MYRLGRCKGFLKQRDDENILPVVSICVEGRLLSDHVICLFLEGMKEENETGGGVSCCSGLEKPWHHVL